MVNLRLSRHNDTSLASEKCLYQRTKPNNSSVGIGALHLPSKIGAFSLEITSSVHALAKDGTI